MRLHVAVAMSIVATVPFTMPAPAGAAPVRDHGITINVIPKQILAGEGVLIYGRLTVGSVAGRQIVLMHHIAGSGPGYSRIGETTTDTRGFYEFTRAEGVVETNRSWFVRELGRPRIHSRTVREQVSALVSLSSSATTATTAQPVLFSGQVAPAHPYEAVVLQQQVGARDVWRTLKRGQLDGSSRFAIPVRFRVPGPRAVRAVFPGDRRNVRSASDPVTVLIEQAQIPGLTIGSSQPIIPFEGSATISGTLTGAAGSGNAGIPLTLCHRSPDQPGFTCDSTTVTGQGGSYSFTVTPPENTVYIVRDAVAPRRHSARLFEGVSDLVTLAASQSNVSSGQPVTFTGTVAPAKIGDTVLLQRLGADGRWHTVATSRVGAGSQFSFVRTFGLAGEKTLRARVLSDGITIGSASPPVTVDVSVPPASELPPTS